MKPIVINNVTHMTMIGNVHYGDPKCAVNEIHDLIEEQATTINISGVNQAIVKRGRVK